MLKLETNQNLRDFIDVCGRKKTPAGWALESGEEVLTLLSACSEVQMIVLHVADATVTTV